MENNINQTDDGFETLGQTENQPEKRKIKIHTNQFNLKKDKAETYDKKEKKQSLAKEKIKLTFSAILHCVAYFIVSFVAVMLVLYLILIKNYPTVANTFKSIGECLGYLICMFLGFQWTRKRHIGWLVGWFIAVVVIIVIYALAVFEIGVA